MAGPMEFKGAASARAKSLYTRMIASTCPLERFATTNDGAAAIDEWWNQCELDLVAAGAGETKQ